MIIPIILVSVITILLVLYKLKRTKPIIKKRVRVSPGYGKSLNTGVFVLQNESVKFVFVKDIELRIFCDGGECSVFCLDKPTQFFLDSRHILLKYNDFTLKVTENQILQTGNNAEIRLLVTKPSFMYTVNSKKGEIKLGQNKPFYINFGVPLCISEEEGGFLLSCKLNKGEVALQGLQTVKPQQLIRYKKENFGFIDTTKWEVVPKFDKKLNALQQNNLQKLLDTKNYEVLLPEALPKQVSVKEKMKIAGGVWFNLDELGFSKIIRLNKRRTVLYIEDLLSNVKYAFTFDSSFSFFRATYFGANLIFVNSKGRLKIDFCNVKLNCTSTVLQHITGYNFSPNVDLYTYLDKVNILLLHGYFVDVQKMLDSLNLAYLPKRVLLKLANIVLNFMFVFDNYTLFLKSKIRHLCLLVLSFVDDDFCVEGYCFLKKLLPLIKDKTLYNKILNQILTTKNKFFNFNYEYFLSEVVGLRVNGEKFYLTPTKTRSFCASFFVKYKRINIKVNKDWQLVKINNLSLVNVDSFQINRLDNVTDILFS